MRSRKPSTLLLVNAGATIGLLLLYVIRLFSSCQTGYQTSVQSAGNPQLKNKRYAIQASPKRLAFLADGSSEPSLNRVEYMTSGLDSITSRTGLVLEISPLAAPLLPPNYEGYRSIDVAGREGLLKKYEGHGLDENVIRQPNYIWTGQHYRDIVGEDELFDLVVASHVLEHVPNLISFLNDVEDILTDLGELRVIFPDYRFCFDWSRQPTRIADIIAAHLENRTQPTVADVYDYYAMVHTGGVKNDPKYHWNTAGARNVVPDKHWHSVAINKADVSLNEYVDVHVWRFDPDSFVEHMTFLHNVGLISLELINVVRTQPNDFEIFATFRKDGTRRTAEEVRRTWFG